MAAPFATTTDVKRLTILPYKVGMKVGSLVAQAARMAVSNSPALRNCWPTSCLLNQAQQLLTGFRSGLLGGQFGNN